jgi:hypothetical protein
MAKKAKAEKAHLSGVQVAEIIQIGTKVHSESGGLKPDPDDTVRIYVERENLILTGDQIKQGA